MPKPLLLSLFILGVAVVFFVFSSVLPTFLASNYSPASLDLNNATLETPEILAPKVSHLETPEPLKAIYMTACVAGTPSWREDLKRLIETTELNAIVIDIKDYTGVVSFPNDLLDGVETLSESSHPGCVVSDMKEFIRSLHESEIYVIGRISVFQDPTYTKLFPELAVKKKSDGTTWRDHKGLSFIDVGAVPYWDYIVRLSQEAYALGFDELNYDYIRYPSDGNLKDIAFDWTIGTTTKEEMLEGFFKHLHRELKSPMGGEESLPTLSADLFGMTTTVENDMNIGQILERALPYFDYIAPMVYPSHYPPTWNGFSNPAEYPYEVVKLAMTRGREREVAFNVLNGLATSTSSKLRPWLQDFNLGATYGPDKVLGQIQATYDSGLTSWALWSAGNKYTENVLLLE